jgi:tetratricopeptide (TPR) repeat protein
MGDVYSAYDPELDRKIAVKLVRAHSDKRVDSSEGRARLLREAQAIARLSHPNVVVVYDVGTFDDSVFIAMEYVDGQTVGYWRQYADRSWREVLEVFQSAGRGLAAAHQAGMVHRDFKPDNVMVTGDGQVRVMDFGLARQLMEGEERKTSTASRLATRRAAVAAVAGLDPETTVPLGPPPPESPSLSSSSLSSSSSRLDARLTQTGAVLGTPAYMAPEQFAGKDTDARTDQFSFCVALYESLYGDRPFEGKSVPALMASVLAGEVQPPPPDTKVPAWLRRTILRGLQSHPDHRYPSMEALLEALARDPAQAWRRRLTMAGALLVGAAVVGAAGAGWRAAHAGPGFCAAGAEHLVGVWEGAGTPSPRKQAVRRAFAATGKSYAENAFASAQQILDRYVGAWTAMYKDACEATHVRGEQSSEVLDLRMACLGERLGRVRALTDVFAAANGTVVENAVVAASALPPLDRCADTKLLRAVVPPPDDPAKRARVEELKKELAHVKVLGDSGQCAAAVEAGQRLIAAAQSVGYLPLEAESLNTLARSSGECMSVADAVRMHKQAVLAAAASHHDEAAAQAMIQLAFAEADRTPDVAQARTWVDLAEATLRGMSGSHLVLELWRLQALARVYSKEGRPHEALDTLQRARELAERIEGPEHPDVARVIGNIGLALQEMNRLEEALSYNRQAEQLAARVLGPDHPIRSVVLGNEGEVLNGLHRYDEALAPLEQAMAIWRQAGSSPFYSAWVLTSLGESLLGLGRPAEAELRLEEALRLSQGLEAPYLPLTRFVLARALWSKPRERPRALELARAAKAEYQRAAANAPRVEEIDAWLRDPAVAAYASARRL